MHQTIHPKSFYYGFPVILLTTCDAAGATNITPISSSWCLGDNLVIGLSTNSKAFENLQAVTEAVINLPDDSLWAQVEGLATLTGKNPVPETKQDAYRYCADKFAAAGLTRQAAETVRPARIAECPLQAETTVQAINERAGYAIIELKIRAIHAQETLLFAPDKVNPAAWHPLIYNFRHYQGLAPMQGKNFRSEI